MAEKTKWYKGTIIQKPETNKKQTKKTKHCTVMRRDINSTTKAKQGKSQIVHLLKKGNTAIRQS